MIQCSLKSNMSEDLSKKRKLSEDSGVETDVSPAKAPHIQCPYLDTINRHVLDFDFEKLCSVSLTRINVYACLVCGKYFQGRGTNTHAYTHSVADGHHVFLNLHTLKFYCLPDNYEVIDSSLNDIKYVLNPVFTSEQITMMDTNTKMFRAIDGDPVDFLSWFLNSLHMALNGTKKADSSIIYKSFLGHMKIYTRKLPPPDADDAARVNLNSDEYKEMITESPFLYLTCDLPPTPLFTDEFRENIIPQVNLYQLLSKFNGQTSKEYKTYKENFLKRFEITQLPPYLILYIKRFTKNTFFVEKNPTVVNFPVKNVDFGDILTPEVKAKHKGRTTYELVGNIVHDGAPEKGTYRAHNRKVGIALTPCALAVSPHLSTSTFKNTALGNFAGSCSKKGEILWHGPHLQTSNT
ncbi:hypothetical protein MSG28_000185 [Choristoneura fumiferana]|uniref:Uncharacterized protein n=1 Tax=Choristoneura fumiferana TaxID=7141 RepID=A0ACC0JZQ2_CHOFU|nr:hypothetical protein MSG28_000185 [Choristoneura fumiferana]